jgi:hypothetical protein
LFEERERKFYFLSVLIMSADATTLSVSVVVENVGITISWNFTSFTWKKTEESQGR